MFLPTKEKKKGKGLWTDTINRVVIKSCSWKDYCLTLCGRMLLVGWDVDTSAIDNLLAIVGLKIVAHRWKISRCEDTQNVWSSDVRSEIFWHLNFNNWKLFYNWNISDLTFYVSNILCTFALLNFSQMREELIYLFIFEMMKRYGICKINK